VKAKDIHNAKSNWSDQLIIRIFDVPVLEIEDIYGSLFKVSVVIKNNGSADAMSVDWSITLNGGFIPMGRETTGKIINIPAGENVTVKSNFICGLGNTVITATAECDESSDAAEQDAFVFLFFIRMINE